LLHLLVTEEEVYELTTVVIFFGQYAQTMPHYTWHQYCAHPSVTHGGMARLSWLMYEQRVTGNATPRQKSTWKKIHGRRSKTSKY